MKAKKTVNQPLRNRMTKSGVGFGEVSDVIGVSESTLYRWLRHELTQEQQQLIETAFEQLGVA